MKILLDPVYTNPANKCASAAKFKKVVLSLLETTTDTYFYWLKPFPGDFAEDCPEDWWPKSPRIEYRQIHAATDRYREFNRFREEYEEAVSKCGSWWDWDVMITNRIAGINNIRIHSADGRASADEDNYMASERTIIALDDMPLFAYKTKAMRHGRYSAMGQASGYMNADLVLLNDFWQRQRVIDSASAFLSAAMTKELREKIQSVSPVLVEDFTLKSKKFVDDQMSRAKPFVISFSGRMIVAHHLEEIFDMMTHKFAIGGDSVKCLVTTQSMSSGSVKMKGYKDFIEIIKADKDIFWDVVKNRSSVGLFFSNDQDYSMSVMEPIILGLPVLLYHCEWAEKSVGADYPYFFRSMKEAYGFICAFYENYSKEYLRFCKWHSTSFRATMLERNKVYLPNVVKDYMTKVEKDKLGYTKVGAYDRKLSDLLINKAGGEVPDFMKAMLMGDKGGISTSASTWVRVFGINSGLRWSFTPSMHRIKRALLSLGWEDASVKTGHIRYVGPPDKQPEYMPESAEIKM